MDRYDVSLGRRGKSKQGEWRESKRVEIRECERGEKARNHVMAMARIDICFLFVGAKREGGLGVRSKRS